MTPYVMSRKNVTALIPHHVDFVVPGVDAENWADADHVVDLGAKVLDELVFYGDTWEKLEVFKRLLEHSVRGVEAVH